MRCNNLAIGDCSVINVLAYLGKPCEEMPLISRVVSPNVDFKV